MTRTTTDRGSRACLSFIDATRSSRDRYSDSLDEDKLMTTTGSASVHNDRYLSAQRTLPGVLCILNRMMSVLQ